MTRPDNADESWRGVGRAMAHNPVGVNGAQTLSLALHEAAARLTREDLLLRTGDLSGESAQRLADESKLSRGQC